MSGYHVNWSELLIRLRARTGSALAPLARSVAAMDERTANRLARGDAKEPRWSQGMALLDFAADHLTAEDWKAVRGWA